MNRIVIIGGGITGLAAAWRIEKSAEAANIPISLELLEASSHLGGTIQTVQQNGFLLESGPDCFITEKPAALRLCRELGIESELIGTRPEYRRSFILKDGAFHVIPEGFYLMGPSRYRPFLES